MATVSSAVYLLSRLSDLTVQMQTVDARSSFTDRSVLCMTFIDILRYGAGWQFSDLRRGVDLHLRGDVSRFRLCFLCRFRVFACRELYHQGAQIPLS